MLVFLDDMAIIVFDEVNCKRSIEGTYTHLQKKNNIGINKKKTEILVYSKEPEEVKLKLTEFL